MIIKKIYNWVLLFRDCTFATNIKLPSRNWSYFGTIIFPLFLTGQLPFIKPNQNFLWLFFHNGKLPDSQIILQLMIWGDIFFILTILIWLDTINIGGWRLAKGLVTIILFQLVAKRVWFRVILLLVGFLYYMVYIKDFLYQANPNIAYMITQANITVLLYAFRIPAGVILTSSSSKSNWLLESVSLTLWPLRSVVLLDATRISLGSHMLGEDNWRTSKLIDWKEWVHRLLGILPFIVIDGRYASTPVAEELRWCCADNNIASKTILITEDDGSSVLLENVSDQAKTHGFSVSKLEDLPYVIWSKVKV